MLYLIAGLAILWASSELFVNSSCNLAKEFKVPKYIIGILITSLGTSLPELVLSMYGALTNHTELVVGNIIGSNIANIAVGLGLLGLIAKRGYANTYIDFIKTDQNFLLVSTGFLIWGSYLGIFNRLLAGFALLIMFVFIRQQLLVSKNKNNKTKKYNLKYKRIAADIFLILLASFLIYFGSKWTITGGVEIATLFSVPEYIIGLIAIALGTSLPEIAVVVASCRKGEAGLALGNIIGSNIYNVCFVLGATALIMPIKINLSIIDPAIIYLSILSVLVYFFLKNLSKKFGALMLFISYIGFVGWTFYW